MALKDVTSAVLLCVWELWLLSLRLGPVLLCRCSLWICSARCFCTQEDRRANVACLTLHISERCRCSPQWIEMDWLETHNDCRASLQLGCSPIGWPLMASVSSPFFLPFFSSFSLALFLSLYIAEKCARDTKTQRKSIRAYFLTKIISFLWLCLLTGGWIQGHNRRYCIEGTIARIISPPQPTV